MSARLRCAIYTRKSTEEGLEQEFNSLDAQREACEAFILSQAGLGWKALPERYDDGGISGGTMNRPALAKLLEEVKAGWIDVVVVYKIDRLTRSLADFARIVDVFDAKGISFVSVTQAFNTTTSMGRLTLNVLLSFAQFEREVTAERIRDKIAASKKKGMWMGGVVPLGYDARDRKLVVNEREAETVRALFGLYHELKSVRSVKERADALGLRTKARGDRSGSDESGAGHQHRDGGGLEPRQGGDCPDAGGSRFTRGHLYQILSNPLYAGKVRHRGKVFTGEHAAIVDAATYEVVQSLLSTQAPRRRSAKNHPDAHLLTGIVFDETGDRLSPTHASKDGKRYRYYASHRLMQKHRKDDEGWRIASAELERLVEAEAATILGDASRLIDWLRDAAPSASELQVAVARAGEHRRLLREGQDPEARRQLICILFRRITLMPDRIRFEIDRALLIGWLLDRPVRSTEGEAARTTEAIEIIEHPIVLKRRGVEMRLILGDSPTPVRAPDPSLSDLVKRAHRYLAAITDCSGRSLTDVATMHGTNVSEVSRLLPMAFLSPAIVEAILSGSQPDDLTAQVLSRLTELPMLWSEQVSILGC